MLSVQQLPKLLVDRIRTGLTLNSLPEAMTELVANSIDADARNIYITLNAVTLDFTVEDDGRGVRPDDLNTLGCRYCTSKMRSMADIESGVRTFGFRGEAISSLFSVAADVCITTRAKGTFVTVSKHVQSGGCSMRMGPSAVQLAHSGTTITVKQFLFNQPVRQRQLVGQHRDTEASTIQAVLRMALPFVDVCVTLLRAPAGVVLLHLPRGRDVAATFLRMAPEHPPSLPLLSASGDKGYQVSAVLGSLEAAHPHPHHQYIYVNRRHVRSLPLTALLNDHFMLAYQRAGFQREGRLRGFDDPGGGSGGLGASRRGSSSSKVFPAFLVLLECPYSDYDVTAEPDKSDVVFKQLSSLQRLLRNLALKVWGPAGALDRELEGMGTASAVREQGCGSQHGQGRLGTGRARLDEAPRLLERQGRTRHEGQMDGPANKDYWALSHQAGKVPLAATGNVGARPGVAHSKDPLCRLLQLQANARPSQLAQSRTMSLAAVITPEREPPAMEDVCKRKATGVERANTNKSAGSLEELLGNANDGIGEIVTDEADGSSKHACRAGAPAYSTRQGGVPAGPMILAPDFYSPVSKSAEALHRKPFGEGWRNVTAHRPRDAGTSFGTDFPGYEPDTEQELFGFAAQQHYGIGVIQSEFADDMEDSPSPANELSGFYPMRPQCFAGVYAEWQHLPNLVAGADSTCLRLENASPEPDWGHQSLTSNISPLIKTIPSWACMKNKASLNHFSQVDAGESLGAKRKATDFEFQGHAQCHDALGCDNKGCATSPDEELQVSGDDLVPGLSPIARAPAPHQASVLDMPASVDRGHDDSSWRCRDDISISPELWYSHQNASEPWKLSLLGSSIMCCSPPCSPFVAKAANDGAMGGFGWVYEGDSVVHAARHDSVVAEPKDSTEDLSWAKGLSPDTIDGIVHLQMHRRRQHTVRCSVADDDCDAPQPHGDILFKHYGDGDRHSCDLIQDAPAAVAGPSIATAAAPSKARVPILPRRGDAWCNLLLDLRDSPDEVVAGIPQPCSAGTSTQLMPSRLDAVHTTADNQQPSANPEPPHVTTAAVQQMAVAQGEASVAKTPAVEEVALRHDSSLPTGQDAVPLAVATSTDSAAATVIRHVLLEGQQDRPLIVGMALPMGSGSRDGNAGEDDEGSLSPLARYLNFGSVSSEPGVTPPPCLVTATEKADVQDMGNSTNITLAVASKAPDTRQSRMEPSTQPGLWPAKLAPTLVTSFGHSSPAYCGSNAAGCGAVTQTLIAPIADPKPVIHAALSTSPGATTGISSHKQQCSPTRLVQSVSSHAKNLSRIVHMGLACRLPISRISPPVFDGLGTMGKMPGASESAGPQQVAIEAAHSKLGHEDSMQGRPGNTLDSKTSDTCVAAAVAATNDGTSFTHPVVSPVACFRAPKQLVLFGSSKLDGERDKALSPASVPNAGRPICTFVWPVKLPVHGSKHQSSLSTHAEEALLSHRCVRQAKEPNAEQADLHPTEGRGDPMGLFSCGEMAANSPTMKAGITLGSSGKDRAMGATSAPIGEVCSNTPYTVDQAEQGYIGLQPEACTINFTRLATIPRSGMTCSKGGPKHVDNNQVQEELDVGYSGLMNSSLAVLGILRKRPPSSIGRTPKRVRFCLPSGQQKVECDGRAGPSQSSGQLSLQNLNSREIELAVPEGKPLSAGHMQHELLRKQPCIAAGGEGTAVDPVSCGILSGSDTSGAVTGRPRGHSAAKIPTRSNAATAQTPSMAVSDMRWKVVAAGSKPNLELEELKQEEVPSGDRPSEPMPQGPTQLLPASHPQKLLAMAPPGTQQTQLLYNQDMPRILSLETDLLRFLTPGEQLVPRDVSRLALVDVAAGIMQQVDRKFIPAMTSGGNLLIVDQHAAHERVRLEHLTNQLDACAADARRCTAARRAGGSTTGRSCSGIVGDLGEGRRTGTGGLGKEIGAVGMAVASELLSVHLLAAPMQLQLATAEVATLARHGPTVAGWGWRVRRISKEGPMSRGGSSGGGGTCSNGTNATELGREGTAGDRPVSDLAKCQWQEEVVTAADDSLQVLVGVPSVCGTPFTNPMDLRIYLHQLHETGGADLLPPAVLRVLRSKACRSAIMFGDTLTPAQCSALLAQLRNTRLWTQCAHGRPTVAPLVHVPTLRAVLARRRAALRRDGTDSIAGRNRGAGRRLSVETLRVAIQRDVTELSG